MAEVKFSQLMTQSPASVGEAQALLSRGIKVIDKDLNAAPALVLADAGKWYIVGPSPTGTWAGQTGKLALWNGLAWKYFTPSEGDEVGVLDEDADYRYSGTAWGIPVTKWDHVDLSGGPLPGGSVAGRLHVRGNVSPGFWGYGIGQTQFVSNVCATSVEAPTAVAASVAALNFVAQAHDGTDFRPIGTFAWVTRGVQSATNRGSRMQFQAVMTNTTALVNRLNIERIDNAVEPGVDNTQTLGSITLRWSEIIAGNATINTSDAREKTAVVPLTSNELACASALAQEIGWFKWLHAIDQKGEEAARRHVGITVQRVIEVMEAHGMDPFAWGFVCYDQWDAQHEPIMATREVEHEVERETVNAEGDVVTEIVIETSIEEYDTGETRCVLEAGDRYSLRDGELLKFIARGQEQRLAAIEARLATLEAE